MYTIGAITEAKTLWSSPVAAQTILGDGLRVLNIMILIITVDVMLENVNLEYMLNVEYHIGEIM